ncbi:enoyl-CoA hydratase/isomerase family protein [Alteromonas oceanisediminis]|uniref:enoyl-CoA hydratase/isomerase family protein n=1 Tax=Alteromonas oceanisediminis TaxID=2836180 RepID=UPI001BD95389|nr:enoyl-CoA hydratase/isomerase family protein [Alteromonas oceanisediminis]MBT0587202.1 enoyl-CoA hydratase/isomerase family protein [Alteromonas oceanisediminis]
MQEQSVLCETFTAENGALIGRIQLNKPKALNAIDLSMVKRIDAQLIEWQSDPNIVCVILDSSGDKAFCAGGDVVSMYKAMQAEPGRTPKFVEEFFTFEYQLDYRIHTYNKPIVVWGKGIIMGGGLGLFNGASHRVVTADTRIAMPEITIGLYPDVGGSWFLNRMPGHCGLFLGLTGASINATDALYAELADFYVGNYAVSSAIEALRSQPWPVDRKTRNSARDAHMLVNDVLKTLSDVSRSGMPEGQLEAHRDSIDAACATGSISDIVSAIVDLDATDDKWLQRAQKGLASGSPITAHIVYEQLRRGGDKTLADCFRMELDLSCRCGEFGEFAEGVRALLIDKDHQPQWRYASVEDVPASTIEWFFNSPWEMHEHPLVSLGESL